MVTYSHIAQMEKRVKVAEFKAQLSAYLHSVRQGASVTVCVRDTPVARIVPYRKQKDALEVRKPTRSLADVKLPSAPRQPVESLDVLLALRQSDR